MRDIAKSAAALALGALAACSRGGGAPAPAASSAGDAPGAATSSGAPSGEPSASSTAAPARAVVSVPAPALELATKREGCAVASADLAQYLQRGELALAGKPAGADKKGNPVAHFAATWLVQGANKPEAQIAYTVIDGEGRPAGKTRGVAKSREVSPVLFATEPAFTLGWFDEGGLAYGHPALDLAPAPVIRHLKAAKPEIAEHVALALTPDRGGLLAVVPFGDDKLGLFSFAPQKPGAEEVVALGVTKHTKKPASPAVASNALAYYVAWREGDGSLVASHFDAKGTELGKGCVLAPPPGDGQKLGEPHLAATDKGAFVAWASGDELFVRAMEGTSCPSAPTYGVGKGRAPRLVAAGDGALLAFVAKGGAADGQVVAVRLGPGGTPSATALQLSEGAAAVKTGPAVAVAGERVGFAWQTPMSATVSTGRLLFRAVQLGCFP